MSGKKRGTLSRREFAGALATAAAAPMLLTAMPLAAQEKKPAKAKDKPPEPTAEERRERALKQIRDFKLRDGAEPAFTFRADWNHG
ncbi:MAG: hypothetical protein L0191_08975 [Acidobacteria bacterium]|nr:hypothetical protein [Acidobacteriota bacterium]